MRTSFRGILDDLAPYALGKFFAVLIQPRNFVILVMFPKMN